MWHARRLVTGGIFFAFRVAKDNAETRCRCSHVCEIRTPKRLWSGRTVILLTSDSQNLTGKETVTGKGNSMGVCQGGSALHRLPLFRPTGCHCSTRFVVDSQFRAHARRVRREYESLWILRKQSRA